MSKHILVLDGHPDPSPERYLHALAQAYCEGARSAGHTVDLLRLADVEFPLLRSQRDFQQGEPPDAIRAVQARFNDAQHIVLLYPLWLGGMPALLKGLLEQVLRPGFAFKMQKGRLPLKLQAGKTARLVVTMGMPAFVYSLWYRAHSVQAVRRNIFQFIGVRRVRATLVGAIESLSERRRAQWLKELRKLGAAAA
jgi:putative NADPH-quinone reductase